MSNLPITGPKREGQLRLMEQLYLLLGKQVRSYHKHHHMGVNTSVPMELAQELLESLKYTVETAGGASAYVSLEQTILAGQALLEQKHQRAGELLRLITATAPDWKPECRWEAIRSLTDYLNGYDCLHLAHRIPEVFYPLPFSVPEEVIGIDHGLVYLNALWCENQIMDRTHGEAQEELRERICALGWEEALNPCEQLVMNGIGRVLLGESLEELIFNEAQRGILLLSLRDKSVELRDILLRAADELSRQLDLKDKNAAAYITAVAGQLCPRLEVAMQSGSLSNIFL